MHCGTTHDLELITDTIAVPPAIHEFSPDHALFDPSTTQMPQHREEEEWFAELRPRAKHSDTTRMGKAHKTEPHFGMFVHT